MQNRKVVKSSEDENEETEKDSITQIVSFYPLSYKCFSNLVALIVTVLVLQQIGLLFRIVWRIDCHFRRILLANI